MCGIFGVVSKDKNIVPVIAGALKKLEYRGYDSVGIGIMGPGGIVVRKAKGDVDSFLERFRVQSLKSHNGIGHTRWATHGAPSDVNAHPHSDCKGLLALVHNGVIRNYAVIRRRLEEGGHKIVSETDSELIAHLIEEYLESGHSMLEALGRAVSELEGSYSIAVISAMEPDKVFFARMRSPLVIGLGKEANSVSSDIPALLDLTRTVVTLNDGEVGWISPSDLRVYRVSGGRLEAVSGEELSERTRRVEWDPVTASKGGYRHFMLKEIYEQPQSLIETYNGSIEEPALEEAASLLHGSNRVIIVGAGTSFHAGMTLSYYLSKYAGKLSVPVISSEHEFYLESIGEEDVVVAFSQSGETYDTLEAVRGFRERGAKVIGITNVLGSALSRESYIALYTRAGPEIGVAATKTFLAQVLLSQVLSIKTGLASGLLSPGEAERLLTGLKDAQEKASEAVSASFGAVNSIIRPTWRDMYILGRKLGVPLALEGALKVKEISYIHAEAYPAGESKHGPIALVSEGFPVIVVSTSDSPEIVGNAIEMATRGASVYIVKPRDQDLQVPQTYRIEVVNMPATGGPLLDPYSIAPFLQVLAYQLALSKGLDPDKPRNLAKTVTVE